MIALSPALRRLGHWHEGRAALRMVVAALVAYALTNVIKLPGAYSAVLTTIIVARADTGGTLQASLDRLAATLLGAGAACAASFGRAAGAPEMLLMALTLAPLSLVVAHNAAYRTSMIAAIIVLSAQGMGGSPVHVALIRTLEVGLGAVVGAAVSIVVAPSSLEQIVRKALMELLPGLGQLARATTDPAALSPEQRDKVDLRVRQKLRELGARMRRRPKAAAAGPNLAGLMVRSASRLNADWGFLARELENPAAGDDQRAAAQALGSAFDDWARAAAQAIEAHTRPPGLEALDAAVQACRAAFPEAPGMVFLTDCLMADAWGLARGLAGSARKSAAS